MDSVKIYKIFGIPIIRKIRSDYKKKIYLFGIEIYSKANKAKFKLQYEIILKFVETHFQDILLARNSKLDYETLLKKCKHITFLYRRGSQDFRGHNLECLFQGKTITYVEDDNWQSAEVFIGLVFGHGVDFLTLNKIYNMQTPFLIAEESFLRCIVPAAGAPRKCEKKYLNAVSHFIDAKGIHFYSGTISSLEEKLNSKFTLSQEQMSFARKMIQKILENHLSKYNCQPIKEPHIPSNGKKNVLIIDQISGDLSITMTGGDESVFEDMLRCAIEENQDSNIIIKGHVDARKSYYKDTKLPANVYYYSEKINIISLLKKVDKVYVYSSGSGMDALLLRKKVCVFGSPIYAGWGLTDDRRTFIYRTQRRSLEELFYIIYVEYARYCNPITGNVCNIEEAIDVLIQLRTEYFAQYKV